MSLSIYELWYICWWLLCEHRKSRQAFFNVVCWPWLYAALILLCLNIFSGNASSKVAFPLLPLSLSIRPSRSWLKRNVTGTVAARKTISMHLIGSCRETFQAKQHSPRPVLTQCNAQHGGCVLWPPDTAISQERCVLAKNWWDFTVIQLLATSRLVPSGISCFVLSEIWGNATWQNTARL